MEPPGPAQRPVHVRADGTDQKAEYQEQRGDADTARSTVDATAHALIGEPP